MSENNNETMENFSVENQHASREIQTLLQNVQKNYPNISNSPSMQQAASYLQHSGSMFNPSLPPQTLKDGTQETTTNTTYTPNPLNLHNSQQIPAACTYNSSVIYPQRKDTPVPQEVLSQTPPKQKVRASKGKTKTKAPIPPSVLQQYRDENTQEAQNKEPNVEEKNTEKKVDVQEKPKGVYIEGNNEVYTTDKNKRGTLGSTNITVLNTEQSFQFGRLITTNDSFMVYAVKECSIRVINKFNAKKTLIKSHKEKITDMKFMRNDQGYMVTLSKDGTLIVWQIFDKIENKDSQKDGKVSYKILLVVKSTAESNRYFTRVEWHPIRDLELVLLSSLNEVFMLNIEDLISKSSDRYFYLKEDDEGVLNLRKNQGEETIHDINFSRDGKYLAAGTNDGNLILWDANTYKLLHEQKVLVGEKPIYSIQFTGSDIKPVYNNIIVGGPRNAEFALFSIEEKQNKLVLQKYQHLILQPFPQHMNHIEVDTSSSFLLVANMNDCVMYAIYLELNPEDGNLKLRFITEYQIEEPVVSFTSMTKIHESNDVIIGLFCVQTKNVRLLSFVGSECKSSVHNITTKVLSPSTNRKTSIEEEKQIDEDFEEGDRFTEKRKKQQEDENNNYSDNNNDGDENSDNFDGEEEEEEEGDVESKNNVSNIKKQKHIENLKEKLVENETEEEDDDEEDEQKYTPYQEKKKKNLELSKLNQKLQTHESDDIVDKIEKLLEKFTEKQMKRMEQKYERERMSRLKEETKRQKELLVTISKTFTNELPEQLERAVHTSCQRNIVPSLTKTVTQSMEKQISKIMQESMKRAVEQSIPRLEKLVVSNLEQTVQTHLGATFTPNMTKAIQQPIREVFHNVLKSTIIPSFEKSCQKMFEQIESTFNNGVEVNIKEPLKQFYLELNKDTVRSINNLVSEIKSNTMGSVPGSGVSPVKTVKQSKKKKKIEELIAQENYEEAFDYALNANDLGIVTWLCTRVNTSDILGNPKQPALSQPVLLALLHQLAFDMTTDTDLKLQWLQHVGLALNISDKTISYALPGVLQESLQKLNTSFETYSAKNVNTSQYELVIHLINSLLTNVKSHITAIKQ